MRLTGFYRPYEKYCVVIRKDCRAILYFSRESRWFLETLKERGISVEGLSHLPPAEKSHLQELLKRMESVGVLGTEKGEEEIPAAQYQRPELTEIAHPSPEMLINLLGISGPATSDTGL